jgi:hypothetical protein
LAAIQIVTAGDEDSVDLTRVRTHSLDYADNNGMIIGPADRLNPANEA